MTEAESERIHDKVESTALSLAKLWTEHRELSVVVQGSKGDNGLRSDVAALELWRDTHLKEARELENELRHYFDVKRVETCHGLKALDDHIAQHIKMTKAQDKTAEGKLRLFMQGWGQILQFAGIIIVALIAAGGK